MSKTKAAAHRKGKKQWRKNVDVTPVEDNLFEVEMERRLGGGPVHEQSNDALFTIDTKGDPNVNRKMKTLKINEIINGRSAIPAILSRSHPVSSTVKKILAPDSKKLRTVSKNQLALIKKKQQSLQSRPLAKSKKAEKELKKKLVDIWAVDGASVKEHSNDYLKVVEPVNILKPKLPPLNAPTSAVASKMEFAGLLSYNPDAEKHKQAIEMAVQEELSVQKEQKKWKDKMAFPEELRHLDEEMPVDGDDSGDEDRAFPENDQTTPVTVVAQLERKTRKQRNKERRRLEMEKKQLEQQKNKKLAKQIEKIKDIEQQVLEEEQNIVHKVEKPVSKKRLGPFKFEPVPLAVQVPLSEDLKDSLRAIKPEGNLFKEAFKGIQEKGLVEPRLPTKLKRKYQLKEIEVHSYKRFK